MAKGKASKKTSEPSSDDNEIRVGVFVCHCGLNIAGSVDVEGVAKFASTLPNVVVAKTNRYCCSDPGQDEIRTDIKEEKLNRVVVASCTPRLHEPTFRKACEAAGLNKYLFEMANIRDHCSWVHLYEKEKGTQKAKDLVRMAVAKVSLLRPQVELEVPVIRKTLIVGGGVAGLQAALDLADTGYKVYLVEKEPSIGGRMAQIDKTFPTLDCSICILAPVMSDVGRHPNIELMANSEVVDVKGYIGNFTATVLKRPRYVVEECKACGDCAKVCPVQVPNKFDTGFAPRKAIYTPFAQAVPSTFIVDMDSCIRCHECVRVCKASGAGVIDLRQEPEKVELDVGTVIIATGADVYDPSPLKMYGYGRFPNVLTSLEFERLINAGGPSGGHLIRPSDRAIPESVAFVQCVGSRSEKCGLPYCSSVCCMNSIKDALLIKEHWPDTKIYVFFVDMRCFGKGYEDLFRRAKAAGVIFIRGLPAEIFERKGGDLRLVGENTLQKELYQIDTGMVILSIGLKPGEDADKIQRLFNLSRTADGFFMEAHPQLRPVDAPTGGIFFAGTAESPKAIKDSVTQASAAAARASILMAKGKVKVEAITPKLIDEKCIGCGLCAKVCPYNAIAFDKKTKKITIIEAACHGCGTCGAECPSAALVMRHFTDEQIFSQIDAATAEDADKKILAFCCNWCSYAGADFAGVSRMQYPTSVRIIRMMCSGRMAKKFIERAFARGVATVLVSGCHIGDCHYIDANHYAKKRVERFWKRMDKLGLDKNRLHLGWFSAAEGQMFADTIEQMHTIVENVTKEELDKTKKAFEKALGGGD